MLFVLSPLTVRYLLSCLAGASIVFAIQIFGYFCLEETKEPKDKARGSGRSPRVKAFNTDHKDRIPADTDTLTTSPLYSITVIEDDEEPSVPSSANTNPSTSPSALELLRHLPLQRVITSGFILNLLDRGYTAVFCLLCYTPVHLGGLSRTVRTLPCPANHVLTSTQTREIGYALAMGGLCSTILLPFVFPPIQRRYGTRKMYCTLMYLWPVVFLSLPVLNVIARIFVQPVGEDGVERLTPTGDAILWLGIGIIVVLYRVAGMILT